MQLEAAFLLLSVFVTVIFLGLSYSVDRKLLKIGGKISKFPKVSIIIPTRNKGKLIKKCLNSVKSSSYPNKEIIVVNDCSTDGTDKILNKIGWIKIIHNKKRLGKSQSLNNAARKVSSDLILFLDADTILEKDTLTKLVASYLHYNKMEGGIGFISPKYKLVNKKSFLAKMVYMEQAIHQFLIKIQMNFNSILAIRGCCLLVNKQAFFKAGGFSNHILEDGDFAAKMKKAGYKMKYEPRASVQTDEPESLNDFFRSRKRYGKGGLFCLIDHTRHFVFSRQAALSFYPYILISLAFIVFSVFTNGLITTLFFSLSFLGLLGLISTIGMFLCGATTAKNSLEKTSIAALFFPYIFLYIPFAGLGYLSGVLSGINDRRKKHGKLKLKEW